MFIAVFTFNSCTDEVDPQDTNYITFEAESFNFGVDIGSSNTNDINVYTSTVSSTERTLNLAVIASATTADPASYTVPTSVTIPANSNVGTLTVTISDLNISSAGETLTLGFEAETGLYTSNNMTINVRQVCPYNEVSLEIVFGGYASETSIELVDAAGNVIASVAPGTWADGLDEYTADWCLENGTYTFTIGDIYGDGLSYPADGNVEITSNGVVLYSTSGDFGAEASGSFTL